jgi:hypothetical protein
MGTVASTNAGLTDVLQTLSSVGSPLMSTLSTPALQSALQNASTSDIVKLSDAALQLENTEELFGTSNSSPANLLSTLESSTPASGTSSTAEQLAAAQSDLQEQQTAALFGDNTGSTSNSLLNVIA